MIGEPDFTWPDLLPAAMVIVIGLAIGAIMRVRYRRRPSVPKNERDKIDPNYPHNVPFAPWKFCVFLGCLAALVAALFWAL